jgi:hypothetical protein
MDPYLLVNALCLLLCALPFLGIIFWFKRRQSRAYAEARMAVGSAEVMLEEPTALWVAIDDAGNQSIRGNGILLLTAGELYFRQLLPPSEIRLERSQILRLERPDLEKGTRRGRLICVVYRRSDGSEHRDAWMVEDHARWVDVLDP